LYQERLASLEAVLKGKNENKSGSLLSGRQLFLLSVSFLVCMVGITNAMLMAITERFREIATMKCLGAKDSFILAQFMMEAGLQGMVGGILGSLIGLFMALLKGSVLFGSYFWSYLPLNGFMSSSLIAFLAGIFLSVLASIYPSWSASRMAPMEAMRVE
jgi:ABC-type antimicrobial peptide transport system permease subunit